MFVLTVTYFEAGFAAPALASGALVIYGLLRGGGIRSRRFVIGVIGSVLTGGSSGYYDSVTGSDTFSFFLLGLIVGLAVSALIYLTATSDRKSYEEVTGRTRFPPRSR